MVWRKFGNYFVEKVYDSDSPRTAAKPNLRQRLRIFCVPRMEEICTSQLWLTAEGQGFASELCLTG